MDIFSSKTILTVSRLTALLRGVLEENFEQLWVEGEVSNFSSPSSGHYYFTIKDAGAQLRCVMFKGSTKNLKFRVNDGMALILRGRISVYDQRGEYQLICEYAEPAGVGALQLAFEQLKAKLAAEGMFDPRHKISLPLFPTSVGIITSPTGAAIHDILNILKRRFASLKVLLYPVRVQGDGAAQEIAAAIDEMNRMAEVDVLIVGRGGGSLEDLWAFNEEAVARALFRSKLPVISAVGHETDWSICDFVADLRAPTPSAAAELVIASASELQDRVDALNKRLRRTTLNTLQAYGQRLKGLNRSLYSPRMFLNHLMQRRDDLNTRLDLALKTGIARRSECFSRLQNALRHTNPDGIITNLRQRAATLEIRMQNCIVQQLQHFRQVFGIQTTHLETLSPLKTLARGYSIASHTANGKVITNATQLKSGDRINLKLHNGQIICRVEPDIA